MTGNIKIVANIDGLSHTTKAETHIILIPNVQLHLDKRIWVFCMLIIAWKVRLAGFYKIIIFIQPILLSGLADNLENLSVDCLFVLPVCHANWFSMHAKLKKKERKEKIQVSVSLPVVIPSRK